MHNKFTRGTPVYEKRETRLKVPFPIPLPPSFICFNVAISLYSIIYYNTYIMMTVEPCRNVTKSKESLKVHAEESIRLATCVQYRVDEQVCVNSSVCGNYWHCLSVSIDTALL